MAERNVELLRPIYEAWAKGDFGYRPTIYAEDWEWGWSDEFPGLDQPSRDPDREDRSERLQQWLDEWAAWRCESAASRWSMIAGGCPSP